MWKISNKGEKPGQDRCNSCFNYKNSISAISYYSIDLKVSKYTIISRETLFFRRAFAEYIVYVSSSLII